MNRSLFRLNSMFSRYRVVHRLPGRIRIHIPAMEKAPPAYRQLAGDVVGLVGLKKGIQDVRIEPISGTVLIGYDPDEIHESGIIDWMEMLVNMFIDMNAFSKGLSVDEFAPLLDRMKTMLLNMLNPN